MRRILTPALLAVALAGCGQQATDSAEDFQGSERAVADVVEDLQRAGERQEPERICEEILTQELVRELDGAGTTCQKEMSKAIEDADDFELQVRDVTVTGQTARATVERREGEEQGTAIFEFRLVRGQWRASSLAS